LAVCCWCGQWFESRHAIDLLEIPHLAGRRRWSAASASRLLTPHPPAPSPAPLGCSHAPISRSSGKERYVFFSMPHISIDAKGRMGAISRPGRPGVGCACGALAKALVDIQRDGLTSNCKIPGGG